MYLVSTHLGIMLARGVGNRSATRSFAPVGVVDVVHTLTQCCFANNASDDAEVTRMPSMPSSLPVSIVRAD